MNKDSIKVKRPFFPYWSKVPFYYMNKNLFILIVSFLILGIIFVFSSSFYIGKTIGGSYYYFFYKQLLWSGLGFCVFIFFIGFDYHYFEKLVKPIIFGTTILLLLVFVPRIGHEAGGANRWIDLRFFYFNPSELAKLSIIIYLAYILEKKQDKIGNFTLGLFPPLCIVGILFCIIVFQSGFSTASVLLITSFLVLFVGGASLKHIFMMIVLSIPVLWILVIKVTYRLDRILAFVDPWRDMLGIGYHSIQSFQAFANGKLFGLGLGNSIQKIYRLPTPHTDFIFAIIVEELGLIGAILIITMYFVFFYEGMKVVLSQKDIFARLLSFGIVMLIVLHAILNIAIAAALVPPTGVALPFISYGGSATIVFSCAAGILLNISAHSVYQSNKNEKNLYNVL